MTTFISFQAQDSTGNKLPYTPSVQAGNLVFISGQVGINLKTAKLVDTSFEAELRQVMQNIKMQLDDHRLKFDD